MELCVDEKWKLSKKGSRREGGPLLKAPASMREERRRSSATRAETGSFSSRCARLVKEQRARFYIMRRCVTMLVCWRDYP